MEWKDHFDEVQCSALKELANVGISHVATAIGEIVREKMEISVPTLEVFSKQQLMELELTTDGLVGAYLTVQGISNHTESLILLPRKDAMGMIDRFVNIDPTMPVNVAELSSEEQLSIFCEISSVIGATYFSAVDSMFGLKTECGIPLVSTNNETLEDFVDRLLRNEEGICITTSFASERSNFSGKFLLIPDPHTLDHFFRSIGLMA